jgi:hypothetical protein
MAIEPDDGDCWVFQMDDTARWKWYRQRPTGERVAASFHGFPTFYECVKDAKRAGYDGSLEMDEEESESNAGTNGSLA